MKLFGFLKKEKVKFVRSDEIIGVGLFDIKSNLQLFTVEETDSLYLALEDDAYVDFLTKIEQKYGDVYLNGYGIESVVRRYLEINKPDFLDEIEFDSEASTFVALFKKGDKRAKELEKILIYLFTDTNLDEFISKEYSNIDWL